MVLRFPVCSPHPSSHTSGRIFDLRRLRQKLQSVLIYKCFQVNPQPNKTNEISKYSLRYSLQNTQARISNGLRDLGERIPGHPLYLPLHLSYTSQPLDFQGQDQGTLHSYGEYYLSFCNIASLV